MELRQLKRMDRFSQLAVAAGRIAIEDAGLRIDKGNAEDTGVLVASGVGGLYTLEEQNKRLLELGPGRVSPLLIPMMIPNMAAAQVSIQFGARGPVNSVCTACAAGTQAIGDAFEVIRRGDAKIMLCGGSEAAITPLGISGFAATKAMSTRNDEPQRASRPFDIERDGFVMGEGAGIIVLEELDYAISRGARILAEIVGYGSTGDAYHLTALESSGINAARAMRNAMIDAGVSSDEIGYINPHGTSTPLNDEVETKAIKTALGEKAYDIPISSTKSMTGHCLGAAGAIEAAICVDVICSGIIPPTINLDVPDPLCDLDYVPKVSRRKSVDVAMSNSMGFGGHNATIIFKRYVD
jgi:3-oxoacyl-[acyl-carrier-protein] synthase II